MSLPQLKRGALFIVLISLLFVSSCSQDGNTSDPVSGMETGDRTLGQAAGGSFLLISDPHLHKGVQQAEIPQGTADSGEDLWGYAAEAYDSLTNGLWTGNAKPDFVICLGDLPWHAGFPKTGLFDLNKIESQNEVFRKLRTVSAKAGIPLIYVPGNNDPLEGDYGCFEDKAGQPPWLGDTTLWPLLVNGTAASLANNDSIHRGYYSTWPLGETGKLRVIVMNTVMFTSHNHTYCDPNHWWDRVDGQLNWLDQELAAADTAGDNVWIAMHVPPGKTAYTVGGQYKVAHNWNTYTDGQHPQTVQEKFLTLTSKYAPIIRGMLGSHTHMDGIRILQDTSKHFFTLLVMEPGITPGHGNNPGMKLVNYGTGSFDFTDFTTFYTPFHFEHKNQVLPWDPNDHYSFGQYFGSYAGTNMFEKVLAAPDSVRMKFVEDIYEARPGHPDTDADASLVVYF